MRRFRCMNEYDTSLLSYLEIVMLRAMALNSLLALCFSALGMCVRFYGLLTNRPHTPSPNKPFRIRKLCFYHPQRRLRSYLMNTCPAVHAFRKRCDNIYISQMSEVILGPLSFTRAHTHAGRPHSPKGMNEFWNVYGPPFCSGLE